MPFIPEDPVLRKNELGSEFQEDSFVEEAPVDSFTADPVVPTKYQKTTKFMGDFSAGFAKKGLKTLQNIGNVVAKPVGKMLGVPEDQIGLSESTFETNNTAEDIGGATERILEFLAPASKISTAAKVAGKGGSILLKTLKGGKIAQKAADLAGQGVVQGITAGGQTALQEGKVDNTSTTNAIIASMFPSISKATEAVSGKIMNALIKPSNIDIKNGFSSENITKYGLTGSLNSSLSKTSSKLNGLSEQLTNKLKGSTNTVDIDKVVADTVSEVRDKKSLMFGRVADMNGGLAELKNDLVDFLKAFEEAGQSVSSNSMPLLIANNQLKRGAGLKGSWVYGRLDKNAQAIEQVYSVFYNKLKVAIEKAAPPGVQQINKTMSKLIPIQSAIIKRIPVAERQNVFGLQDTMFMVGAAFDPATLAVYAPYFAFKRGTFATILLKASQSRIPGSLIKSTVSELGEKKDEEQF